jgi:hypothetical protein
MTPAKYLLYRLNFHKLLKKQADQLSKFVHYLKFAEWVSQNHDLELNDFRAPGSDYKRRYLVHEYLSNNKILNAPVSYLEFGVADGETLFWWLDKNTNPDSRFFGFDTFTGLPEDWGNYKKGTFDLKGIKPQVADSRVSLYKGLFQETLFEFLQSFDNSRKNFILLDADLYSSTLFVLTTIAPYLKTGDILLFDEFSAQEHEFLAYMHFLKAFPHIRVRTLAAANNYACVAFEVVA